LVPRAADVLVAFAEGSGPAPDLSEHPAVQFPDKGFVEDIGRPGFIQPGDSSEDGSGASSLVQPE
jgi:hypothetical protein